MTDVELVDLAHHLREMDRAMVEMTLVFLEYVADPYENQAAMARALLVQRHRVQKMRSRFQANLDLLDRKHTPNSGDRWPGDL